MGLIDACWPRRYDPAKIYQWFGRGGGADGSPTPRPAGVEVKLNIKPLHPVFAAEITGIDLRTLPSAELRRALDDAMDEYAVVVVRDQLLDDDQHLAFADRKSVV